MSRAVLHAGEVDLGDRGVRGALRLPHRIAERRDAQHASAGDDDAAVVQRRAGVEHLARRDARRASRGRGPRSTSPVRGASG